MDALCSFLSLTLVLAACAGCQAAEMSTPQGDENGEITCDTALFASQRELCDSAFKLNIPHSHGDMRFTCSVVNKYKTCLTNVIREARCGQKAFLVTQLQPMQEYIRENNIACIIPRNATFNSVTPAEYRAKLDLCTRDKAWETQFLCAKKFHSKLRKIEDDKEIESHQICRALSRYYSCLNTVLHNEACEEDTELMSHMEYFPKVLSQKYREMCVAELKLTAMNVAKRLSGYTQDSTCKEEDATKEFFACGLLFNEIASQNPPKDKLCMAYRNYENCTNSINMQQSCSISSEFQGHASHVMNEILSSYSQFCSSFQPPLTQSITSTTAKRPPQPIGGCDANVYLERYFECGLSYVFTWHDAVLLGDNPQHDKHVCEIVQAHTMCLNAIGQDCQGKLPIHANLEYFNTVLKNTSGKNCGNYKRSNKLKFRSSQATCHIREYAGTYFTCGTIFLKRTFHASPSQDEKCRFYNEFLRCQSLLIICKTPSDMSSSFNIFSKTLTDGFPELCAGYANGTVTCDPLVLLKNFFTCGLNYYQAYREYIASYLGNEPHICKVLDDFQNCTQYNVLNNDCKQLQELFTHIRKVRHYIGEILNAQGSRQCKNMPARQKRVYLGLERQTSCDQFKAVKKLVLCGVAYHRMLTTVENNSLATDNHTNVCPLVKEMKYCMYSATHDSGCSDALFLNTEISVLKKHLLREFEDVCNALPPSEDKEFKQYRQGM
ncbi:unnamed protein product [Ixodes hexagonus]